MCRIHTPVIPCKCSPESSEAKANATGESANRSRSFHYDMTSRQVSGLPAQLKSLKALRREREKAANAIRRIEDRKALASVASLPHSPESTSIRFEVIGECRRHISLLGIA